MSGTGASVYVKSARARTTQTLSWLKPDTEGPNEAAAPRAVIGPAEAIALTVGVVVGAGIFKAPSLVAGMTGSAPWMFAAWALGGLMSLVGALCYAELSTAYASAGGDYHFLQRAYGRPPPSCLPGPAFP
ncbi:amino acid permease [Massilia scottii]|uniref:amino acid permease n=1 Tax=Massilia scottii TaxID=3057166 RepID=UPI002796CCBB|nr:amino acid permease [Massilia sp. CCM 9029]MDQ1833100.1 amino acid permease [Massilia sp. CCM 9029]